MTSFAIVIGASAGGVEALRAVVSGLPPDLPAAVIVVLHIPRDSPSMLAGILDRAGPLPAVAAQHGASLRNGTVYVAPADHHVLVEDGTLRLSTGPIENGHRPAIDPLFRSAALAYGPRAIGVVLSGTRDDGTAGLAAIAARGGGAVVQDLQEAIYPAMPSHALDAVPDARVHTAGKIGAVLAELTSGAGNEGAPRSDDLVASETGPPASETGRSAETGPLASETAVAAVGGPSSTRIPQARPSELSCPSCHGVLFEVPGHPAPRFRCRTGHAWSPSSLEGAQAGSVDDALWVALRAQEEKVQLLERLADEAADRGHRLSAENYRRRAAAASGQTRQVRALLGHDLAALDAAAPDSRAPDLGAPS